MRSYIPYGVSPAVLLPFDNDLAIDEAAFRKHLRDVAATDGISAITINAHSTEVAGASPNALKLAAANAARGLGTRSMTQSAVHGSPSEGSISTR